MSDDPSHGRVPMETRRTTLTLAVRLVDGFTRERPTPEYGRPSAGDEKGLRPAERSAAGGRYPRVSLRIGNRVVPAVRNPSGFDLFLDVAIPDDATPTLAVEGGRRYLDRTLPVAPESLSPLRPTADGSRPDEDGPGSPNDLLETVRRWRDDSPTYQTVRLRPSPAYRFPPGATLLRGRVRGPDGEPLGGVTLTVDGAAETAGDTETTPDGEFVVYFVRLTEDDVTDDGRVQIDGANPRVELKHEPEDRDTTESLGAGRVSLTAEEGRTRVYALQFERRNSVNAVDVTIPRNF